jgi:hypothetical protein
MKPSEAFGVVIRSVGLLLIVAALWVLFGAILTLVSGGLGSFIGMLIGGMPMLFVGIWLLGGAPYIVSIAYPDLDDHKSTDDKEGKKNPPMMPQE